jgi:hypothetical protein
MTKNTYSTRARQIDWPTLIPTLAPLATYGLIMALVILFGGEG